MRYYADALPQFATKLLRIDAPVTGDLVADFKAWCSGKAETWSVRHGWSRPTCSPTTKGSTRNDRPGNAFRCRGR
jgi:hypothetical protein